MAKLTCGILNAGPAKWSFNLSGVHTVCFHAFETTPWRSTIGRINPNGDAQPYASPGEDSRCSGEWHKCHPTLLPVLCLITLVQILSYVSALQTGQWSKLTLTSWDSSRCDEILPLSRWWPSALHCSLAEIMANQLQQYDSPLFSTVLQFIQF